MKFQKNELQEIHFHGSFYDAEELNDYIETLELAISDLKVAQGINDEPKDFDLPIDLLKHMLNLFCKFR
tara:strand:+ start:177 stop:383 length:207 start_codon:yes stop_codon:yes gene_type:complete